MSLYLLDSQRKRILLRRCEGWPFPGQFVPFGVPLNERESPTETICKHIEEELGLPFLFMGHSAGMPSVLDERTVKLFPPLHVQVTMVDAKTEFVDYVYLGFATQEREFDDEATFGWFNPSNLKTAPTFVKHNVFHILGIVQPTIS